MSGPVAAIGWSAEELAIAQRVGNEIVERLQDLAVAGGDRRRSVRRAAFAAELEATTDRSRAISAGGLKPSSTPGASAVTAGPMRFNSQKDQIHRILC
ncbi:MAG TPA: hypothetical protein VIK68_11870 [Sphingomicrobium sp.]